LKDLKNRRVEGESGEESGEESKEKGLKEVDIERKGIALGSR
jgi:hypothetical protein